MHRRKRLLFAALLPLLACEPAGQREQATSTVPTTQADVATSTSTSTPSPPEPVAMPEPRCRPDMVRVRPSRRPASRTEVDAGPALAAFCVDRYEAMLVDHATKARISPYYAPSRKWATYAAKNWASRRLRVGGPKARAMPLPKLPVWETERDFEPRAIVRKNVTPNGHVSGNDAATACRHAGKRLCTPRQWRVACGGEQGWQFPYGPKYIRGKCNVFREAHPAAVLHDNPAKGHTDPRLNQVTYKGRPLLRRTGTTPSCASKWEDDAIYDMVGNLDEWVDVPKGSFAGGFYARSSKKGCDWRSTAHPMYYADYSTGVRCCADLPTVAQATDGGR